MTNKFYDVTCVIKTNDAVTRSICRRDAHAHAFTDELVISVLCFENVG